eukprot:g20534.t1
MAAMILANVLQPFPDQQDRTELASLLALLSGFFQVLMGVFDLASAVRFLSQPTLSGFVTGGAQEDGSTLVPSVGYIPEGLPPLRLPWQLNATEKLLNGPADVLHGFVLSGAIVAFSTFLTSYSSFKKQALACDYNLDARQELYALGAAGILGSFFGAFPPSDLPKASLAAIVMVSAEGLMDFKMPLQLWGSTPKTFRSSFRKDLIVWFVGFLCTILAGALYGIMLSVLVALAQVVAEAATPQAVTLGEHIQDVDRWAEAETLPGILVFEFRGPLVFASAEWFEEEVERRRLQAKSKVNFVILCMGAVATIDYSALEILRGILLEWRRKGLHCLVADANSTVLELLREQLGHELLQQFQTKPAGQTAEVHFEIQEVLSIEDAVIVASQKLKCLQADSKRMADPV